MRRLVKFGFKVICGVALAYSTANADAHARKPSPRPPAHNWSDAARSPEDRARLLTRKMTTDEKLNIVHGIMALPIHIPGKQDTPVPAEAIIGAGYVPGIPRLGVPPLLETDASLGVAYVSGMRRRAQPVSATPVVVYRLAFQSPRSFADVD